MRKFLMTLIAAMALSGQVMAQDDTQATAKPKFDKTEMVKRQTARMVEAYGLDETQAQKLLALNTSYAGKMRSVGHPGMRRGAKADSTAVDGQTGASQRQRPSRDDVQKNMTEMRKNMEAYNKELKAIMTDEQYAKYEADKAKRMQHPGRRPSKSSDESK